MNMLAVIDSIYTFILRNTYNVCEYCRSIPESVDEVPIELPEASITQIPSTEPIVTEGVPEFKHIQSILAEHHATTGIGYVHTIKAPLFARPTTDFDSIVCAVSYGSPVTVHEARGRFLKVTVGSHEGWMLKDDVIDSREDIHPQFTTGNEYSVDDPTTVRVRACIDDEFGGGKIEYPLQAGEYVLYRLIQRGVMIQWPDIRPRTPGRWHEILKGVPGIHMTVIPKTGSIMEYEIEQNVGHVAYVESVSPDGTIHITETNYPDSGIYSERILDREEWLNMHPIFIECL
jgi:hypothetical protein